MGCCGHSYKNRKEIEEGIRKNTLNFKHADDKLKWGRKDSEYIRSCGVCHNIIKIGDEVFCPLHPERNSGDDLRDIPCDKEYMCRTFYMFNQWDEKKQKQFILFIKSKKLDWFTYSIGMDNGTFLNQFEKR